MSKRKKVYTDNAETRLAEQQALYDVFSCIWPTDPEEETPPKLTAEVEELEKSMIQSALEVENQNRTRAAERLGISRENLIYKIKKYKL
jgi:transcriptional regulator with PAS, ATPase and Fis domain